MKSKYIQYTKKGIMVHQYLYRLPFFVTKKVAEMCVCSGNCDLTLKKNGMDKEKKCGNRI